MTCDKCSKMFYIALLIILVFTLILSLDAIKAKPKNECELYLGFEKVAPGSHNGEFVDGYVPVCYYWLGMSNFTEYIAIKYTRISINLN